MVYPFKRAFDDRQRVQVEFTRPSRTHQSFQKECDINAILAKWQKTGLVEHVSQHKGHYGDFLSAQDYHTCVNQVIAAQDAFASLPSSLRAKFYNDPAQFLAFVEDPKNAQEMYDLGLVTQPVSVQETPKSGPSEASSEPR